MLLTCSLISNQKVTIPTVTLTNRALNSELAVPFHYELVNFNTILMSNPKEKKMELKRTSKILNHPGPLRN